MKYVLDCGVFRTYKRIHTTDAGISPDPGRTVRALCVEVLMLTTSRRRALVLFKRIHGRTTVVCGAVPVARARAESARVVS